MNINDILLCGAKKFGLALDSVALSAFNTYYQFLCQSNKEVNLTAVDDDEIVYRHFIDSMACFQVTNFEGKKLIDIGSGAGFPGVPIALCSPSVKLTLLDSQIKRVTFLKELCLKLSVKAEVCHSRAEESGLKAECREKYDIAASRALAKLSVLAELCLPFVKTGGLFLAMKQNDVETEVQSARKAVETLGGSVENVVYYELEGVKRSIVVIRKTFHTPQGYPRGFNKIKKQPIN